MNDGYRMVHGSQLVMFMGTGSENELILTNKTEQQLTSKLLGGFVAGLVMTGLGLLLGFGGVALAIVDAITD